MTTTTLDNSEPKSQSGFLSRMFNKITAPVKEWVNEIKADYEEAKNRVETGSTPISAAQKADNKQAHLKHIMKSVYTRDIVEDSPEGLRASIQQFYDEKGGGFDVEEVAKYAENVPIADREKLTPAYLKNPQFTDELTA